LVELIDLADSSPTRLAGISPAPYRYRLVRAEVRVLQRE